ncbi:MAG: DUF4139 domain-containing protein [Albidovulum sp.]|uniref:DUF4139 domain-containing protein n=1 Tax=Albidovulum sp. TaxID=1872424 RepID=UPI003C988272
MRLFLIPLMFLPAVATAETFEVSAPPRSVTLFPQGARVERNVAFSASAGEHRIIIPGLPEDLYIDAVRLAAPEGVIIGTSSLARDRLPVTGDGKSDAVLAAEAEVERLEEVVALRDDAIAAIRLRTEASEAQIAYLTRLGMGEGAAPTAEDMRATAEMIGAEVASARQAAIMAATEVRAAERAREDDSEALDDARQTLAALTSGEDVGTVLTITVFKETDGETSIDLTTYTEAGSWFPAYDMFLSLGDTPDLRIDRGAMVSQSSGEDWTGVDLTLSTARAADETSPRDLWPRLVAMESEEERRKLRSVDVAESESLADFAIVMEEPVMEASSRYVSAAELQRVGDTVTYHYPHPVDLRTGADDVRIGLDRLALVPELFAKAVPQIHETGYLMAGITNNTGEIILPGTAIFHVDGALRGTGSIPLVAAGDEVDVGFGAIDGLKLTRTVPDRSAGDRGFLSGSNALEEVAVIEVRNLTDREWPVRLYDQVPYSEQDDLKVTYTAEPRVTVEGEDGRRGVLRWDISVPAGEAREIRLEQNLSWPSGMVLR